jgi:hypothetical protein
MDDLIVIYVIWTSLIVYKSPIKRTSSQSLINNYVRITYQAICSIVKLSFF